MKNYKGVHTCGRQFCTVTLQWNSISFVSQKKKSVHTYTQNGLRSPLHKRYYVTFSGTGTHQSFRVHTTVFSYTGSLGGVSSPPHAMHFSGVDYSKCEESMTKSENLPKPFSLGKLSLSNTKFYLILTLPISLSICCRSRSSSNCHAPE